MKKLLLVAIGAAAIALLLFAKPKTPSMGNKTVVVELFTSQG